MYHRQQHFAFVLSKEMFFEIILVRFTSVFSNTWQFHLILKASSSKLYVVVSASITRVPQCSACLSVFSVVFKKTTAQLTHRDQDISLKLEKVFFFCDFFFFDVGRSSVVVYRSLLMVSVGRVLLGRG